MENLSKSEFISKTEAKLQEKIAFAKMHALSEKEYADILEQESKMQKIQNKREPTDEEGNHFYKFRKRMTEATITVETLPEARRVMEILGFDNDSLINTLSHENAHGNKAEQLGAKHFGYKFCLIKADNGDFLIQPQASIDIPEDWEKEKQNEILTKIIEAPEEYDNKMSQGDKEYLKTLLINNLTQK